MSTQEQTDAAVSSRNRRKKYVINPSFQWKYALITATAVFLITSILSSVLYGLLHHQAHMRMMHPETYTAEVTMVILMFGVAFAGVSAIGVGIWSVLVTHRFCGPLFVMERHMKTLAAGRIPAMRNLRKKDEFKDYYETFRSSVEAIRNGRATDLQALQAALSAARSVAQAGDDNTRKAFDDVVRQLSDLETRMQDGLTIDEQAAPQTDAAPDNAGNASVTC